MLPSKLQKAYQALRLLLCNRGCKMQGLFFDSGEGGKDIPAHLQAISTLKTSLSP